MPGRGRPAVPLSSVLRQRCFADSMPPILSKSRRHRRRSNPPQLALHEPTLVRAGTALRQTASSQPGCHCLSFHTITAPNQRPASPVQSLVGLPSTLLYNWSTPPHSGRAGQRKSVPLTSHRLAVTCDFRLPSDFREISGARLQTGDGGDDYSSGGGGGKCAPALCKVGSSPVGHARLVERHEVDLTRRAALGRREEYLMMRETGRGGEVSSMSGSKLGAAGCCSLQHITSVSVSQFSLRENESNEKQVINDR